MSSSLSRSWAGSSGGSGNLDSAKVPRFLGAASLAAGIMLGARAVSSFVLTPFAVAPGPLVVELGSLAVGLVTYLALTVMFGGLYAYSLPQTHARLLRVAGHAGAVLGAVSVPTILAGVVARFVTGTGYAETPSYVIALETYSTLGIQLAMLLVALCALGSLSGAWKALPFVVPVSLSPLAYLYLMALPGAPGAGVWITSLTLSVPAVIGALASLGLGYAVLSGRAGVRAAGSAMPR